MPLYKGFLMGKNQELQTSTSEYLGIWKEKQHFINVGYYTVQF